MISERAVWWGGLCLQCEVCGHPAVRWDHDEGQPAETARNGRCERHSDRNPCAIEGCRKSRAASGTLANDAWLCEQHWRRFVPPRSLKRRAYHALFHRAKRYGWTPKLYFRYRRMWGAMVAQARRRAAEGYVDVAGVNEFLGL